MASKGVSGSLQELIANLRVVAFRFEPEVAEWHSWIQRSIWRSDIRTPVLSRNVSVAYCREAGLQASCSKPVMHAV